MTMATNNEQDWTHFNEIATEFANELRNEKTKAWEDFTTTINYATEPTKTMKVLKVINREPSGAPPNSTMQYSLRKPVTTDQGKFNLFQK